MTQVKMKEISLDNLNQAEKKITAGKWKRIGIAAVAFMALGVGGYAAFRMLTGDILASRFTVTKMNCPACVITVKEITGKLPGVVETDVSLASQDVTVKFREKQISPDQIKDAISRAGYPTKVDGTFTMQGAGKDDIVVALVNGKPVFKKDVSIPLYSDKINTGPDEPALMFFSAIGKEILLQAADKKMVVVQPAEVEEEIESIIKQRKITPEEFDKQVNSQFGSREKYFQVVAQRLGLRKLIDDHVAAESTNPEEKNRKTLEWLGTTFKDADVKILDSKMKEVVIAAAGQDEWKTFWPRVIGSNSELKTILIQ